MIQKRRRDLAYWRAWHYAKTIHEQHDIHAVVIKRVRYLARANGTKTSFVQAFEDYLWLVT